MIGKAFRNFAKLEASSGIALFVGTVLAISFSNSPWHSLYHAFFNSPLSFNLGPIHIGKPLLLWINDGLMSLFFFLIGMEIKREMMVGELNSLKKSILPAIAAIGGMLVPACIFIVLNRADSQMLAGWAIPTATDIAFSLAILSLLGKKIPLGLKIFLMALAIFDDIGAIIIIAIFYTGNLSLLFLLIALFFSGVLWLMNRLGVVRFELYMLVGGLLWLCVLESGVHATLAGIVAAFAIPLRDPKNPKHSPLRNLEGYLHPWVAFGILPLFAFANAGISFYSITLSEILAPLPLGIALGLFLGKQMGITGATLLAARFKWAELPHGVRALGIYGVSLVAGVGFTMSLFIGGLAFGYEEGGPFAQVRLGVLVGSLLAGLTGFLLLRYIYRKDKE